MILLTTPSVRAPECATAIQTSTGQTVRIAASLQEALGFLREQSYDLIIFDHGVMEADPDQAELAIQHTGTAVVLDVNCAIAGAERIAREARRALRRREKEILAARESAEQKLCSDLRQPLTALILESE